MPRQAAYLGKNMAITKVIKTLAVALLLSVGLTTDARADGFISPFLAVNFGGDAGGTFNNNARDRGRTAVGGNVGFMGGGILGLELDVAYTKNFYGEGMLVGDNSLLTVMPAVIFGIPIGGQQGLGVRPYATAGIGMIRRDLNISGFDVFDGSDLAYTLGFGVMGYFSNHVGIRADYKYLRNFEVDDASLTNIDFHRGTFDFSRAGVGILVRF
jgi:opacity protein-like surface antigen